MDDISAKLVEALYEGSPAPVRCGINHARGLLVEGRFRPSAEARLLSAAALFNGPERSLVARFSSFSGNLHIAQDGPGANPRGLALRMEADGGMDLVGHSASGFPAGDPERFLAFLEALNAKAQDRRGRTRRRRRRASARAGTRPADSPGVADQPVVHAQLL